MAAFAACADIDDPLHEQTAFAEFHDLYRQVDRGAGDYVRYLAGALYGIAQRRGLAQVASEAACVAAYASNAAGDAAACAVWAELCLRSPGVDGFDWAPLAHALSGAGHAARGDLEAARNAVRRVTRLLDRPQPTPTCGRAIWIAATVRTRIDAAQLPTGSVSTGRGRVPVA